MADNPLKFVAPAEAAAAVPGAVGAVGAVDEMSPFRVLHRMSIGWMEGATQAERFEALLESLRVDGFNDRFVARVEAYGPKILKTPANKLPKALFKGAGGASQQALFTQTVTLVKKYQKGRVPKSIQAEAFKKAVAMLEPAGLHPSYAEALRKAGPEMVLGKGPTQVLSTYEMSTKTPWAARMWTRFFQGGVPSPKAKPGLPEAARAAMSQLQGAEAELADVPTIGEAKGMKGKATAALGQARKALAPGALPEADPEIAKGLRKGGVKGMGRGASALRKLGGGASVLTGGILAYTAYDSLVGKKKRARAALEQYQTGQSAAPSMELIRDVLDRQDSINSRKALLSQNPQLMQQIVTALSEQSGRGGRGLTRSEMAIGAAEKAGSGGKLTSRQMDQMLEGLLGQMVGM